MYLHLNGVEFVLLSLLCLYISVLFILFYGNLKQRKFNVAELQPISVLIPAKDEETNIKACLNALASQNFPNDFVEIIVLNDNSEDQTKRFAETFRSRFKQFKLIDVPNEQENHLVGKSRAISLGVKESTHDLVLICDADCQPNSEWLKTIVSAFTKEVGVVSGFTLLDHKAIKKTSFAATQTIDWMVLQAVASASAGIGKPISCIGSNLAFRKAAYYEVGGYENLPFSITEDLLLYKTISSKTNWKFVYPMIVDSVNWSLPMNTYKAFYEQRKRWAIGSLGLGGFGFFLMIVNLITHISIAGFSLYSGSDTVYSMLYGLVGIDFIYLLFVFWAMKQTTLLKFLPIYLVYYIINFIIMPIALLVDRKVVWKNRTYSLKGSFENISRH